jgi:hypothetical protein
MLDAGIEIGGQATQDVDVAAPALGGTAAKATRRVDDGADLGEDRGVEPGVTFELSHSRRTIRRGVASGAGLAYVHETDLVVVPGDIGMVEMVEAIGLEPTGDLDLLRPLRRTCRPRNDHGLLSEIREQAVFIGYAAFGGITPWAISRARM